MLINYFDKYNIDTKNIEEKLNIIEKSKTENASYISHMLINTLKYLFSEVNLNENTLYKGIPKTLENVDAIIYFDTILSEEEILKINLNKEKLIIIGNHQTCKKSEKIECINIKENKKIKNSLKNFSKICIGANIDSIDFSKYYYTRMRSYFLNVLNSLNEISIEKLSNNTEEVCTELLLEKKNFTSHFNKNDNKIEFKKVIEIYSEIIKKVKDTKIEDKYMFYNSKENITEMKKIMLEEMSSLADIINIKDKEERISKIYDIVCDKMLKEISDLNYCNFINNKCVTMRYTSGFPNSKENGCCANTYKDKKKNCRYLKEDYSCLICSISCRIFTCAYLQDRGIDHALWQYPIIDCTMGKIKKQRIILGFFTPKEKMMRRLK